MEEQPEPGCGDGVLQFNESCDDGNTTSGDGCDSNCTQTFCGNGITAGDEKCDDGNTVSGDGCDVNCTATACGNGVASPGETCDDGNQVNGDGCDVNCGLSACGNGIKGDNEQCDDGNTTSADGCSGSCATELLEMEPNEDGTPSTGGGTTTGNDFGIAGADANGAVTGTTTWVGALSPAGDEDVVKLSNTGTAPVRLKLDTWNLATGFGIGVSCGSGTGALDTMMHVRNAAGTSLASNNDRDDNDDWCAGMTYPLFPGETVYVHVFDYGDNDVVASYALDIVFEQVVCGDGDVGPGEQCDDTNTAAGDGCSATCQIEGASSEVEPNEDGTPSTGGSGINGNDFGSANALANGTISSNTTIIAAITPVGDEDVFAITNSGTGNVSVSLDIWNLGTGFGIGVPCGDEIDTGMHVRDAAGASLGSNDDRNGATDRCSTLTFGLTPGQTRFAHVISYGDNSLIQSYAFIVKYTPIVCGDSMIGFGETCDDGNTTAGDGCDAACQIEPICGNSMLEPTEQCDDGNTTAGDGCSGTCQLEGAVSEVEPNEDGSPSTGGTGIAGNDFGTAQSATYSGTTRIAAKLDPVGDEDVFAFTNTTTSYANVRFDTWNLAPTFGIGTSCAGSIDTGITIRNAAGGSLASNDDRVSGDACSGLLFALAPGQTVYAHVTEYGDNGAIASYALDVTYTPVVCGDSVVGPGETCDDGNTTSLDGCSATCQIEAVCGNSTLEPTEQCDDGNTNAGDGCSTTCQLEGVVNETEPNEDGSPSTGGSGIAGNDFATTNATTFSGSTRIAAKLTPAGDEDVFAFTNTTTGFASVRFDIWNAAPTFGIGTSCGSSIDTGITIRNAAATSLASNDDRVSGDACSGLTFALAPGQTVYAHVTEFGDNAIVASYVLDVTYSPVVCGDSVVGPGEDCDDGNTTDGDGCSATCTIDSTFEIEPNNTSADAAASTLQVTGDVVLRGAIGTVGDLDRFQVTVATPTVVRFESFTTFGQCASGTTLDLRVFDSASTQLVADTVGQGIGTCGAIVTYLAAGTYFVQVEERGNNATVPSWYLDVAYQDDNGTETEPNETYQTAAPQLLSDNEVFVLGDHMVNTDADVYSITVPAGARIRAEVIEGDSETCESNGVDSRLTLLDDAGVQLVDDDDDGRGFCSLIDGTGASPLDAAARNATTSMKTYYLMVRASSFSQTGVAGQFAYRLQLTIR